MASIELLRMVVDMIKKKGFKVDHIDSVIIMEEPKIIPFKKNMKQIIAETLGIEIENMSIKATTQEGVGAIGRGEAVAAYAVACLNRIGHGA
jgi:2-C-methyl-D-erythritol 2,4-cyclodiphosphate synthase